MIDHEKIHNQCFSKDSRENFEALKQLINNFSSTPDKKQAWNDLIQLTSSKYCNVSHLAAYALDSVFSEMPNKEHAWNDLIQLTNDKNGDVKKYAASVFTSSFAEMPDKQLAWEDVITLTKDKDKYIRIWFTSTLGSIFSEVPDKQKAWNDLITLTNDQNSVVRSRVASALITAFSEVPDKQKAWNDLIILATDNKKSVQLMAVSVLASVLASVFSEVPDKQRAWNDLIILAKDNKKSVRRIAVSVLASVFSKVPDKQKAWSDLITLTNDEDRYVISRVFAALNSSFSKIPHQKHALKELYRLTTDKNRYVRTYANHSLGKIYIFRATRAEKDEDYKKELEKAIGFFEKAAQSSFFLMNPAQFCLPFYRSFHTIVFKKQEANEEVDKYLTQAKRAVGGSKSKKLLFGAVQNLADALKEVQNFRNLDLETKKSELDFYRKYCDHAAELIEDADIEAPYATEVLRKGLPILDRNIKDLLEEIQKKAEIACKESKKTATKEIACTINREVQNWEISNSEKMAQNIEDLAYTLKNLILDIPQNEYILNKIDMMRIENDLTEKFQILSYIIGQLPKNDKISIKVEGNENNVVFNSKKVNIRNSRDTPDSPKISSILEWISEHIIAALLVTIIGGIVVVFIQNKYFS